MSSASKDEDAGFCPVIMRPALTAKGDPSATARAYFPPLYALKCGNVQPPALLST